MRNMPTVAALIPARSGSKRVAGKNIRKLGGHPLMAYTISAALEAGIFQRVVVSTDDERYADIARYYGAEVPLLRPPEFATATSPDVEWIGHMLTEMKKRSSVFDCFSILRPTSPFRSAETIRRAWREFVSQDGVDSLRAVERVTQHPGKMWVVRGQRMLPLLPLTPASQPWHSSQMAALPEVYIQNASLEIAWTRVIWQGVNIAGNVVMPFMTDEMEGFDINTECDWAHAEHLLAKGAASLPPVAHAPYVGNAAKSVET